MCYNETMKTIDEDIKNKTFRRCYLFYGEEAYLKKQYKDKLVSAMIDREDRMNFSSYEGKNIVPEKLVDLAETLPFFSERRVILVEESGFFKSSCEVLADYLQNGNESTCFVFVESEVDKRSKTYKALKKNGAAIEFTVLGEDMLTRWVLGRIKKENKKITQSVLQLFFGRTGRSMNTIDRELEKLLCYTLKKDTIEAADVEAVVTEQVEHQIFEMVDAIAGHNQKKALGLYDGLLTLEEPPMHILLLIVRQFRILSEVKELTKMGYDRFEIAEKMGLREFVVRKNQALARNFTLEQLLAPLKDAAETEEAIKTGRMDGQIAVEVFIMQYSRNAG